MKIYLKEPSILEKEEILSMVEEYKKQNINNPFEGLNNFSNIENYEEWLKELKQNKTISEIKPHLSNQTTYVLITEEGKVLGGCNIRHHLVGNLINFGGHIGYSIRPTERKKGYGKLQLLLALEKCQELGIGKVLVTCRKENIGSSSTIKSCLGIKENEFFNEQIGTITERYWINTEETLKVKKLGTYK